ncbi:pre-peptidase C-terminal domain-containing protein [Flavobacterium cheniae]|uniref:Pre-peptidase n=1 Tax=Flavobacterium cheniae TaxID=295428 RepID=A0A562KPR2_9FLAO|nr:pre-peptidase C-terminal domain-containing protein [Flavobacterium cheniae]TDR22874.1 pre-peptidase [Flavobacterium cheniae]TWH97265.1 pre-peptidase [Flavobacterium cheniae]
MKKINIIRFLFTSVLFSSIIMLTACNDDDTDLGSKVKPVLTSSTTTFTAKEGDVITLDFTLDKAINKPIEYRLVMLDESTATDMEDYSIPGCRSNDPDCVAIEENGGPVGYIFEIPAYTTSYSVDISLLNDLDIESTENLKLKVVSNRTLLGTVNDLVFDINIENSSDLVIDLNWSGSFDDNGTMVDNCDLDMDLELIDSNGDYIDFSYSNCPEQLVLSTALADGTYYLDVSLWTTYGYNQPINIPASVTFNKPGLPLSQTVDVSSYFPMDQGGLDDGNSNAIITFEITKVGHIFTITNPNSQVVFQGRNAKRAGNRINLKK